MSTVWRVRRNRVATARSMSTPASCTPKARARARPAPVSSTGRAGSPLTTCATLAADSACPRRRTGGPTEACDPRAGRCPGALQLPSRVDLRVEPEVEADPFEQREHGARGVDVGGGEDAGVLLDDGRRRELDLRGLERLDRGPAVVPVAGEERG